MSTDFAMTVRTIPSAILRPGNIQDIKIGIRLAKELGFLSLYVGLKCPTQQVGKLNPKVYY